MKRILFTLIMAIATSMAIIAADKAEITFDTVKHDFGTIPSQPHTASPTPAQPRW